eukprot:CAMPEP_0119003938 /NCGR_PEP_ID=MMETSP1176-20130426/854_1 /TAXON_ID=265551 /ORGANISM="Synedropsis recta cf, Strain CCMP1620" /LENGTH=276 /DNA_ID=CAMNT_0006955589 /DNA_START=15 /DNA_END=845 /DNA_ORIENTATION=-
MGVSSIQSNQDNLEPHKRSKRAMVLLRRVKSLGRRSTTESPHFTKTGKKQRASTPTTTSKKTVPETPPDPPPFEMLWDAFDGIPHVVTIGASADQDEFSQVSLEKTLREMTIIERPLTPIPANKSGFSNKVRSYTLPMPVVALIVTSSSDEWPSDEEDEMETEARSSTIRKKSPHSAKSPDSSRTFHNICSLQNIFSPTQHQTRQARDEQEEDDHEKDDTTANLSSSRDKSLTSSCSSYTPSFPIQDGMVTREEGGEQRDDAPAQSDPLPAKYRLV